MVAEFSSDDGEGRTATSSAFAVCNFDGEAREVREDHQSPEGRC